LHLFLTDGNSNGTLARWGGGACLLLYE